MTYAITESISSQVCSFARIVYLIHVKVFARIVTKSLMWRLLIRWAAGGKIAPTSMWLYKTKPDNFEHSSLSPPGAATNPYPSPRPE